ncbi:CHAT domain-containing protein [Hwangdonia lutea]|uniref:CHAT domain-containing protein n=1 Tax=Hwangdonia lutea TaxID=3075823 RepID=A0AA97HSM5_9FLAO|nr:CHAT domain-containing protein [Hwangdonia sp. SCSIO 19198]WOD44628.1 CHAT domain-containing protein [Hwangdonia sp. SCSIO 19198]
MKRYPFICFIVLFFYFGNSQSIYQKDNLTILADSLHNEGEYDQAITVRDSAIKTQLKAPKAYRTYLKAKYFHTNSSRLEFKSYDYHNPDRAITKITRERYLDSALQYAIKARDLYINVEHPDRMFQYQLQNRIYHQTAYLGNWKHALEQAELGYGFLEDTLTTNDKTFVDLIYDIGFIHSKLGDYSKAVNNYQKSLDLYKYIIGENNTDVAQAYNNISVEYRYLGLRKKELESLLKAKTIWEQLNDDESIRYLYTCYGNLFFWYSYYGDFEKAEAYILKKDKIRAQAQTTKINGLLNNKEDIYEDKLSRWYDLMLHYFRKKDSAKTVYYADTIIKTVDSNSKLLKFEVNTLSSTLKFYASLIKDSNPEKALDYLNKAINIQNKYKAVFYTKPFVFQLYKAELLFQSKKYAQAALLLKDLRTLNVFKEISNQFKLAVLSGKAAQMMHQETQAQRFFDDAFNMLNNSNKNIEKLKIEDLKPLISFETIDGFLGMGDFYFQLYKNNPSAVNLEKAKHRYLLASEIYHQLYLGQRYNESLFTHYNSINERLLKVALEPINNTRFLVKTLNSIENNGSKLTWSKFVFNNQRQQLNIPQNLIAQEENINAQLNFYQKALVNLQENSDDKVALWKAKVYELKNSLSTIQDSIRFQNKAYYQLNVQAFDIASIQNTLKKEEGLLKYIFTDEHLYSFLITQTQINIVSVIEKTKVLNTLKTSLNALKQRAAHYQPFLQEMSVLLLGDLEYQNFKRLTIIPDGALHYFPFETLMFNEALPLIGYAPSLLLFQEQQRTPSTFANVNIGAFSASNNRLELPQVSNEINAILSIFDGTKFLNAVKADFVINANEFNVLHLAMHSKIDEVHPEFSALDFYGENDNKLFISELYNESLSANMVVLSACDTGSGFYENGEGVISLSRAFNYAGIPSTVMSLWEVDDEATAKIMTYFYAHLKLGETKDEALKNAKLDYLKNTEDELLKHPYYWSGFVLSGNTDALLETQKYWAYLFILPMITMVFFRKRLFQFFKK